MNASIKLSQNLTLLGDRQRLGCRLGRQRRLVPFVLCQASSNSGAGPSGNGDNLSEKLLRVRRRLGLPTDGSSNGATPPQSSTEVGVGEWGAQSWYEDWDPSVRFSPSQVDRIADEGVAKFRRETRNSGPRDKWITPLLDWDAVREGLDPDQERSEQMLTGEALVNKEESQLAVRYIARLIGIPLVTGFVVSRALADPILNFSLRNNPDAFELSDLQKYEGAKAVHVEETRLRLDMAIGRIPPLNEMQMFEHLAEFAAEVQEEERNHNETILINAVSDSISFLTFVGILSQATRARDAMYNTMARLFYGLSDIAKAVGIILVADTLLGYHSEEGWHGLIELVLGHYGIEPSEEGVVIFVGIVPVVIDVFFKYWIFIGLNRISPGAVVTIKQVDRH
ncbi:hypothetical protein VaNZ11_006005 [Volvox africanus]|uniref:Chloroplast envelope membrane protein n=1 Tax=Volvox africanus TaxID=51714 RepID=A0ABQ5S0B8_9CHLO|nr:hypothetical protein VaNZ11_006005 [Volvox africanus]